MSITTKIFHVEVIESSEGSSMSRYNDGFNALELLGLLSHIERDISDQLHKRSQPPKLISKVVVDNDFDKEVIRMRKEVELLREEVSILRGKLNIVDDNDRTF